MPSPVQPGTPYTITETIQDLPTISLMDSTDLITQIMAAGNNPAAIQALIYQEMEGLTQGLTRLVDPTNPVAYAFEVAAITSSAAILAGKNLLRRQFPALAQTPSDLYYHMSDQDFVGVFASPTTANFVLWLKVDSLYQAMVQDPNTGIYQVAFPAFTQFISPSGVFSIQYPIRIQKAPSGALSVYWDRTYPSPLVSLNSNVLQWQLLPYEESQVLAITVPATQFEITSYTANLNASTGFSKNYNYTDQFYYVRAYIPSTSDPSGWTEILTTASAVVYDSSKPTLVYQVDMVSSVLTLSLPQIYFSNGLVSSQIRIDVYTTKGALNANLQNYPPSAFNVTWSALDNYLSQYTAPMQSFAGIATFSDTNVTGGTNGMTFYQLKQQVIANSVGINQLPITPSQFSVALNDIGFSLVTDIDNVTSRVYLATASVPAANYNNAHTPANIAMMPFQTTAASLSQYGTSVGGATPIVQVSVLESLDRMTIMPNTVYQNTNGVLSIVAPSVVNEWLAMQPVSLGNLSGPNALVAILNDLELLYSPFHYVMDLTGQNLALRPYYLEAPEVLSLYFIDQNLTIPINVSVGSYAIDYNADGTGYTLTIQTVSDITFKKMVWGSDSVLLPGPMTGSGWTAQLQLSYVNPLTGGRLTMVPTNIVMVDDPYTVSNPQEPVFQFDIKTNFDIDSLNNIYLNSFGASNTAAALTTVFDLLFVIIDTQYQGQTAQSDLDSLINTTLLPGDQLLPAGLLLDQLTIQFGSYLADLYQSTMVLPATPAYATYPAVVYYYYPTTVYLTDSTGTPVLGYNSATGTVTATILHNAGDPVLDSSGNQVILHNAGDIILNPDGTPQYVGGSESRAILNQLNLLLISAKYYFSTDPSTLAYKTSTEQQIANWAIETLSPFQQKLLERTNLYYYPQATTGSIEVTIGANTEASIPAAQSLTVTCYLTDANYQNANLQASLTQLVSAVMISQLNQKTISTSAMQTALLQQANGSAVSVDVTGLGGALNLTTMTIVDGSMQPSIAKVCVVQPSGNIAVQDAITVVFVNHSDS